MNRIIPSLISALVLLGSSGIGGSRAAPTNTQPRAQEETTTAPNNFEILRSHSEEGPWSAICHYFVPFGSDHESENAANATKSQSTQNHTHGAVANDAAGTHEGMGRPARCVPRGTTDEAEFLIVTVPDPISSHLAMDYDRSLESIERAAAIAGYAFDRYWLPWDELYAQGQTDLKKAHDMDAERHLREEEPGLFLFHRATLDQAGGASRQKLLFVFLVGETPTYGINKVAFSNAILYIHDLQQDFATATAGFEGSSGAAHPGDNSATALTIHVAGPSFSASMYSLAALVEQAHSGRHTTGNGKVSSTGSTWPFAVNLSLVSGSVTNPTAINTLITVARENRDPIGVTFSELIFHDGILVSELVPELQRLLRLNSQDEIAFLSESSSSYRVSKPQSTPSTNKISGPVEGKPCDPSNLMQTIPESDAAKQVLSITFPRGIAPLRNAYQKAQEAARSSAPKGQQTPQVNLALSYSEAEVRDQESVAAMAQTQTPLSQDAVLEQIARTLRQKDIKAVVIFATDALDTAFLMQYLRQSCPDIRVVLPSSDLLYVRTGESADFTGTVAFGVYPLFTSSTTLLTDQQKQASSMGQQLKFPSSFAEGHFFAVLSQLRPELTFYDADTKLVEPVPKLWAAVIGRTGFWPLHPITIAPEKVPLLRMYPRVDPCSGGKSMLASADPPNSSGDKANGDANALIAVMYRPEMPGILWSVLVLLVVLGGTLHSAAILVSTFKRAYVAKLYYLEYFAIDHAGDHAYGQYRAFFLLVATTQIMIIQTLIFAPSIRLRWGQPGASPALVLLFGALLLSTAALVITAYKAIRGEDRTYSILAVVTVGCFVFVIAVWLRLSLGPDSLPFAHRSVYLTSGVSPVVPLLLISLGVYVWATGSVRRITLYQNRRPDLPDGEKDSAFSTQFAKVGEHLKESLNPVLMPPDIRIPSIVAIGLFIAVYLWIKPRSLEGSGYDFVFLLGVCLVWGAILVSVIRLLHVWQSLKTVLRRLERMPLRYAFNRIPAAFSWAPVWRGGGMRRSYLLYARSLEYLRCIQASEDPVTAEYFKKAEQCFRHMIQLETYGVRLPGKYTEKMNEHLNKIANVYIAELAQCWGQGGADASLSESLAQRVDLPFTRELKSEQKLMMKAEFVAMRFVAHIRYISLQMRNLLVIISINFILAFLALKSYPFQPSQLTAWSLITIFVALSVAIVYLFTEMDRDALLSRLSNTAAGKLDRQLLLPLLRFGALPLLTVLASQIPAVSNFLFSWVQPTLQALH